MSLLPTDYVYQGFWVDHSLGSVLGATITLDSTSGNIIIAFLSGLIGACGVQLWGIVAYLCYAARASDKSRDGLHHQQQLLFRNINSPSAIMLEFGKLAWYWRNRVRYSWLKCAMWILLALGCSLGFIVAGIFSSKVVTSTGLHVLVSSHHCGTFAQESNEWDTPAYRAMQNYLTNSLAKSLRYARNCYNNSSESNPACQIYVEPSIPLAVDERTDCPFGDICDHTIENPGVLMDTGPLDTNDYYGINAKPEDRITIRKVTTCSLIEQEGYLTINTNQTLFEAVNGREPLPGEAMYSWNYGGSSLAVGEIWGNTTMFQPTYSSNVTGGYTNGFALYSKDAINMNSWAPIEQFNRTDADVTLLWIYLNHVSFIAPSDDPLFSAHVLQNLTAKDVQVQKYLPDRAAGVVGCANQYQFCKSGSSEDCTELTGSGTAYSQASQLDLNQKQNATLNLFISQVIVGGPNDMTIVGVSSPAPLLATQYTQEEGTQYPIPSNQWEIEIRGWMDYVLSMSQKIMAGHAIGPGADNPEASQFIVAATDPDEVWTCGVQKMSAPAGFSNISVFGLSFIVAICCVIILTNITLVQLLRLVARFRKVSFISLDHWREDGILNLQKKAYEGYGYTDWDDSNYDVPVTRSDEQLSRLSSNQRSNSDISALEEKASPISPVSQV